MTSAIVKYLSEDRFAKIPAILERLDRRSPYFGGPIIPRCKDEQYP